VLVPNASSNEALFNVPAMIFSAIGALIFVLGFNAVHHFMERHTEAKVETEGMETESKLKKDPEEEKEEE
jgi:dsRNA-specific ribonuclease